MSERVSVAEALAGGVRTIEDITEEILRYKDSAGSAILEIGRRLLEAKEALPHGDWLPWLEGRVEFSQRQAQNFMRLARAYPNPQPVADLGARKALALLSLPGDEREAFLEAEHLVDGEVKSVPDMSARALEQAIADKKAAEQARDKLAEEARLSSSLLEAARAEGDEAASRAAALREELEELRRQPTEIVGAAVPDEKALESARAEGADLARKEAEAAKKEAEASLKTKLDKAQAEAKTAAEKLKSLQAAAAQDTQSVATELELYKGRAEALEKQLMLSGSKDTVVFSLCYDGVKEDFNRLLGALAKIGLADPATYNKLVGALEGLVEAMGQNIPVRLEVPND